MTKPNRTETAMPEDVPEDVAEFVKTLNIKEPEVPLTILGYLKVDIPGKPVPCISCEEMVNGMTNGPAWMAMTTYGGGAVEAVGPVCERCANE